MHASPPFQVIVRRFGAWHLASFLLVAVGAVVAGSWALAAFDLHSAWVVMALSAGGLGLWALARRLEPFSLRWDTQRWYLGAASSAGCEPQAGRVRVAIDLGAWMLLHFVPDEATVLHRGTWLPVQRFGHEPAWHAFRCTVYCARSVSLPIAAPF
jgi:hypothetical protein